MTRTETIVAAVDNLIRVHDEWANDPHSPEVPTDRFEAALLEAAETCDNGDTPQECREIVTCMSRLKLEWDEYERGSRLADHRPRGSFWGAFKAVLQAKHGMRPFVLRLPEPVSLLVAQKVSERQIALYIYGDGKDGPLCTDGVPDSNKIAQEAAKPGSVVPEDWVHPQDRERKRMYDEEIKRRLQAVNSREEEGDYVDPATIEELLRQGQFPSVVARVKRVPIEDVLKVATRLGAEGVKINQMPNLAAMRAPQEPQLTPEQDAALQPRANLPDVEDDDADGADLPGADTEATLDSLIVELAAKNPQCGAGELVPLIAAELGETVTVQKVTAVLRKAKANANAA